MKNKIFIYFLIFGFGFYLTGCSSGPYELKEADIKHEEKTIKADTVKTVTETSEKKEEIKEEVKSESFIFIVQVGAFFVTYNFERFYENAKAKLGENIYYEMINDLYKIRLGRFDTKAEALQLLDHVKGLGYDDAFIITVRNK